MTQPQTKRLAHDRSLEDKLGAQTAIADHLVIECAAQRALILRLREELEHAKESANDAMHIATTVTDNTATDLANVLDAWAGKVEHFCTAIAAAQALSTAALEEPGYLARTDGQRRLHNLLTSINTNLQEWKAGTQ
jgi:hypothetical protein